MGKYDRYLTGKCIHNRLHKEHRSTCLCYDELWHSLHYFYHCLADWVSCNAVSWNISDYFVALVYSTRADKTDKWWAVQKLKCGVIFHEWDFCISYSVRGLSVYYFLVWCKCYVFFSIIGNRIHRRLQYLLSPFFCTLIPCLKLPRFALFHYSACPSPAQVQKRYIQPASSQ